jgi:hypothetical protein
VSLTKRRCWQGKKEQRELKCYLPVVTLFASTEQRAPLRAALRSFLDGARPPE